MKRVRKLVRQVKQDPYLLGCADQLRIEMVKWDPHTNHGLFVVYDAALGRQKYDCKYCQWDWVNIRSSLAYYRIWRMVNYILLNKLRQNEQNR